MYIGQRFGDPVIPALFPTFRIFQLFPGDLITFPDSTLCIYILPEFQIGIIAKPAPALRRAKNQNIAVKMSVIRNILYHSGYPGNMPRTEYGQGFSCRIDAFSKITLCRRPGNHAIPHHTQSSLQPAVNSLEIKNMQKRRIDLINLYPHIFRILCLKIDHPAVGQARCNLHFGHFLLQTGSQTAEINRLYLVSIFPGHRQNPVNPVCIFKMLIIRKLELQINQQKHTATVLCCEIRETPDISKTDC